VGLVEGQLVILRPRRAKDISAIVYIGKGITVRYVDQGFAHGFETVVLRWLPPPFSLLFVHYPDNLETLNLRDAPRIDCCLPAHIHVEGLEGEAASEGMMLNLSIGGCQLLFDRSRKAVPELTAGSTLRVDVQVAQPDDKLRLEGAVRSLSEQNGRLCVGVQFTSLAPTDTERIRRYVDSALTQPPRDESSPHM
jgi:c-di-GMP-binding flagellar brake protein YcgR